MIWRYLKRLTIAHQTQHDFTVLNSRFLDPSKPTGEMHEQLRNQRKSVSSFPITVQGNSSKHSINWLSSSEICRNDSTLDIPIICPAVFTPAKRGAKPTASELRSLFLLGDNKLKTLPLLPVFTSMPVYITQNIGPKIRIANGSTGFVVGFQFAETTVSKKHLWWEQPLK